MMPTVDRASAQPRMPAVNAVQIPASAARVNGSLPPDWMIHRHAAVDTSRTMPAATA